MVGAVVHAPQTLQNITQLGEGALSKAAGAIGMQQDAQQKAKTESLLNALVGHYEQSYGSMKGFKQNFANDPASFLMDLTTVAGGAGGVAKLAGLGKLGETLGVVGSAVDPIANSVRLAKLPLSLVSNPITRTLSSAATGVPGKIYDIVNAAGSTNNPAFRKAYIDAAKGGDATEFLNNTQNAIKSIRQGISNDYIASKGAIAQKPVPLTNAYNAVSEAYKKASLGSGVGAVPQNTIKALDEAKAMIDDVANNPAKNNIQNIDALKQQIWDLKDLHPDYAGNHLNEIYHGIRTDLGSADQNYMNLMEKYQNALSGVKNISSTLGAGGKSPAAGAALTKTLRQIKTVNGKNVLDQIAEHDPTIPYMLAGHAVNSLGSGWMNALGDSAVSGLLGGALLHPMGAAAAIPGIAIGAAASSPKINAALHYGAGAVGRFGENAAKLGKVPYYAGRANEEEDFQNQPQENGVFDKMLQIESQNNQFKKDGSLTVSPVGAIGAAQVMPGTGPTAAALAGEDWSLERLKSDPEYNRKLGKAYYQSLISQFGDPIYAAAAYNGGPERIKNAIEESKRSGRDWSEYLKPQTQNYVRMLGYEPSASEKTAATGDRIQRASGGRAGQGHEQLVNRLMTMAKQAKKVTDKSTEPLLNAPDEAIVKALDVAQQAI
jgi:hypothetical protein